MARFYRIDPHCFMFDNGECVHWALRERDGVWLPQQLRAGDFAQHARDPQAAGYAGVVPADALMRVRPPRAPGAAAALTSILSWGR